MQVLDGHATAGSARTAGCAERGTALAMDGRRQEAAADRAPSPTTGRRIDDARATAERTGRDDDAPSPTTGRRWNDHVGPGGHCRAGDPSNGCQDQDRSLHGVASSSGGSVQQYNTLVMVR
jgi:hypothetical protein